MGCKGSNTTQKDFIKLADDIYVYRGAVNTGVLIHKNKAVLIDCCDSLKIGDLKKLGADTIDTILFTQHRRTHTAGAYQFAGNTKFMVPQKDKHLFEDAEAFWQDPQNRWHLYHYQPGPLVMTKNLQVSGTVTEDDIIKWEEFVIEVLETPGATDGSVSYIVRRGKTTVCFSGDVIYGNGQIYELYSLQKGNTTRDYHGFMGNAAKLIESMRKISLKLDPKHMIIPSHGDIINNPVESTTAAIELLNRLYENYCSISSVNYYFPGCLGDVCRSAAVMKPAECAELPDFIKHVEFTTFALISDNRSAMIIDCGCEKVADILHDWVNQGVVRTIDACWVTHYHDDHVDHLGSLASEFCCPVMTTAYVAEVIEYPGKCFLPCISPNPVHVGRIMPDGYSWEWNEFTLTAMHLPGQTLYHSGLLVEGHGIKILLAGDSFSPNGIDDYCSGNRNFTGKGRGYRYCIDVLRKYEPDYILNQHQLKMFKFTGSHLAYLEKKLIEREHILTGLLPWNAPDFGIDEWWLRSYPYEQTAEPGEIVTVELHITNHGTSPMTVRASPMLPERWVLLDDTDGGQTIVPPFSSGSADKRGDNIVPDGKISFTFCVPQNTCEDQHMIMFRIFVDGSYFGQLRHAIVLIKKNLST